MRERSFPLLRSRAWILATLPAKRLLHGENLDRSDSGRSAETLRLNSGRRFTAINLDATLEMSPIFYHDPLGRNVSDHRGILFDLNALIGEEIAGDLAIDNDFGGDDLGSKLRGAPCD